MLSFYVRSRNDTFSHIKFGSWDRSKTEGDIFKTRTRMDSKDWEIESKSVSTINELVINEMRYLDFDPAFPNTYVPNEDWQRMITSWLFRVFPGNEKFIYSQQDNHAYYKDTCANMKAQLIKDKYLDGLTIWFETQDPDK